MSRRRADSNTIDLFAAERAASDGATLDWPGAERFAVNANGRQVRDTVWADLLASNQPLIVTGYASLDRVIDYIAEADGQQSIRVLFGHEPFASKREHYKLHRAGITRADTGSRRGHNFLKRLPEP